MRKGCTTSMPTRYLLIGGAGFIGGNLAHALIKHGQTVRILDSKPADLTDLVDLGADYVEGDIEDGKTVTRALTDIDVVFHLACATLPQSSNENIRADVERNLLPTIDLLHESVQKGIAKFIFISSGGTVYGFPKKIPLSEDHPTNPQCSYGITKLAIEKYLGLFGHLRQLDYTVLRLSNPYGPGQDPNRPQGAISVFLNRYLSGQPIQIWGDGEVVRDYLYIDDAVSAMILAAETRTSEPVLNVGSGTGASLNQILSAIESALNIKVDVEYLPAREVDVPKNILDVRKISDQLGWRAKTGLDAGIKATWAWLIGRKETKVDEDVKNKAPLLF